MATRKKRKHKKKKTVSAREKTVQRCARNLVKHGYKRKHALRACRHRIPTTRGAKAARHLFLPG